MVLGIKGLSQQYTSRHANARITDALIALFGRYSAQIGTSTGRSMGIVDNARRLL